jgi:transmembrane sensor
MQRPVTMLQLRDVITFNFLPMPYRTEQDRLFEEANAWFFRLQASELLESERMAFEKWLTTSPAHQYAWQEVQDLLQTLETPAKNLRSRCVENSALQANRRQPLFSPIMIAAAMLLCLGLAYYLQPTLLQNLQSDYYTATGEQREIVLADGTHVLLNTNTAIQIDLGFEQRRIKLLRGEAFFDVVHDPKHPFQVNAGKVNAKDIGTAFSVSRFNHHVEISVSEGVVEATAESAHDQAATLSRGESAHYESNKLISLQNINKEQELAWRDGRIVFIQATLDEIVRQINRYRPGKLLITDPKLKQRRLTAVFYLNRLDDAIYTLQNSFGIPVLRLTNYLILLG